MSNTLNREVLDKDVLTGLLEALYPVSPPAIRRDAILARILALVDGAGTKGKSGKDYFTVGADEGVWTVLTPLVQMKLLHTDRLTRRRSFLLRLQPNGSLPAHDHCTDEECMVLEGEASLGGIIVHAGDYHIARKGSRHGVISSRSGALLFLHTGSTRIAA